MKFIAVSVAAVAALAVSVEAGNYNYMWHNWGNAHQQGCVQRGEYNKYTESYGCKVGTCNYQQAVQFTYTEQYLQTEDNHCLVALNNKPGCRVVLQPCRKTAGSRWTKHNDYQYINQHGYCLHYQDGYLVQQACGKPTYTPQVWQCKPKPTPLPAPTVTVTTVTIAPKPTPAPVPKPCTCQQWNGQCYQGYQMISNPSSVTCTGNQCAASCCVPKPAPAPCTCQQWNGQCYRGYQLVNNPWSVKCTGNQCADTCCVPVAQRQYTCGDYFNDYGMCDNAECAMPYNTKCNMDGYFYSNRCQSCASVCCSVRPRPNPRPNPNPYPVPTPPEVILAPPVCGDWFTADSNNVCGVLNQKGAFAKCHPTNGCDADQCCY